MSQFPQLHGNAKTDVLIIGGGIAGILCAHALAQEGLDYILVEKDRICNGITKNTTAKITVQHGMIYADLMDSLGKERTQMYLRANREALAEYKKLCNQYPCAYKETDSYVYSTQKQQIEAELSALHRMGYHADFVHNIPLPVENVGAVRFKKQAQFHPLQFLAQLSKNLNIYENTKVQQLEGCTAITNNGKIHAKRIIVATHFPFLNKHGGYFLKMYQHRSYVLALEGLQSLSGMYIGAEADSLSFRSFQNLLLLGGGGHRTGKHGKSWSELETFAKQHYPQAKAVYKWATQDCMTLDGLPYIGQYSKGTADLYVITGFNKWGMTNAMAGAMLLRDLLLGKHNLYASVFSPSRSIWHPQLFINTGEALTNLLSFAGKRCPHMGCTLKWNPNEHTWDCPCHGSRFSDHGNLLDGPATDDHKNIK